MIIRDERDDDRDVVHAVNVSAFGAPAEAELVDQLREQADPYISLVAEDNGTVIGHIMFSPVTIANHAHLKMMGLAPMAVDPPHQRSGVGTALVRAGLERCVQGDYDAVVVLGHADYYPRFGFKTAADYGLDSVYDVPAEFFMVIELKPGCLANVSGRVSYHPAFSAFE